MYLTPCPERHEHSQLYRLLWSHLYSHQSQYHSQCLRRLLETFLALVKLLLPTFAPVYFEGDPGHRFVRVACPITLPCWSCSCFVCLLRFNTILCCHILVNTRLVRYYASYGLGILIAKVPYVLHNHFGQLLVCHFSLFLTHFLCGDRRQI